MYQYMYIDTYIKRSLLQCKAVCCSALQYVAVCAMSSSHDADTGQRNRNVYVHKRLHVTVFVCTFNVQKIARQLHVLCVVVYILVCMKKRVTKLRYLSRS